MSSNAARMSEPTPPNNPSLATSYWDSAFSARVPAIIPLSVPDVLLSTFDEEERAIIRVVRQLRTLRNTRAPISRLPHELLTRIFALCAPADTREVEDWRKDYTVDYDEGEDITAETSADEVNSTPDEGGDLTAGLKTKSTDKDDKYEYAANCYMDDQLREQYCTRPLIAVTHVCRAWRTLAINSALLWVVIDLSFGEHGAHEMVRRAKNAPLTFIRVMDDDEEETSYMIPQESALGLIIDNSPHVRSLRLDGHDQALNALLDDLPSDMPLLESLHLKQIFTQYVSLSLQSRNASNLHAPRLCHLLSHQFRRTLDWARPSLHSIESLEVAVDNDVLTPLATVIDILEGLPNLARLCIASCSYDRHSKWLASRLRGRRVILQRLMQLTLRGSPWECTYLLANLAVPARALLRLNVDCDTAPDEELKGFFEALRQSMGSREGARGDPFEPVAARIQSSPPCRLLVEAWMEYPGDLHICSRARKPEPDVLLDIHWMRGLGVGAEPAIAAAACKLFWGSALAQVALTAKLKSDGWDSLIVQSPRLRRVCAWGITGEAFLSMLVDQALPMAEDGRAGAATVVLPHLSSLALSRIRKGIHGVEEFSGWCAERARSGHPVSQVVLKVL
ncbi:hypothetical protein FA95DRAFT_1561932 [Auriscalpium vulgare]|uniref:Uncharacterized protein n=1 Tax=Auriscalpium vulgare TaxID=40419 RepID=A0ACB8RMM6_9AGAM|nr:hypothetical protein FA95DRAFT_1561932 [Auriscalpium vulgare]